MYALTQRRLSIVAPIFKKYRAMLLRDGSFSSEALERELREALSMGYLALKDVMRAIVKKHPALRLVAAYYMQNSNAPGIVSEYKPVLAALYGVKRYDAPERPEKQQKFWEKATRRKVK